MLLLPADITATEPTRLIGSPEQTAPLAAPQGLSCMYRDHLAQRDVGMLRYDAFCRWYRDANNGDHDWPAIQRD